MQKRLLMLTLAVVLAATLGLVVVSRAGAATVVWQRTYDGPLHGGEGFTAVVRLADDSVYVAGYCAASFLRRSDMLLARYSPDGTRKWVRLWNGPACGSDRGWGLARDAAGALYMVGSTAGRGGDAAIVKYSASGKLLWSRRYDSGGGRQDDARWVRAVPGREGVYVVVETRMLSGWRWRVIRYAADGSRSWTAVAPAVTSRASDVVIDSSRNVYVSGSVETASGSAPQLVSYDRFGKLRWTGKPQAAGSYSRVAALADRRDGIAWATNSSDVAAEPGDALIAGCSYASFEEGGWSTGGFAIGAGYEFRDLASQTDKSTLAVGTISRATGSEGLVVEVDAAGAAMPDGMQTWSDSVDCSGDLVVVDARHTGWIGGKRGTGFSVLHYEPGSGLTWRYDYVGHDASRALALTATSGSGAYVTGWGRDAGKGADALIMRVAP